MANKKIPPKIMSQRFLDAPTVVDGIVIEWAHVKVQIIDYIIRCIDCNVGGSDYHEDTDMFLFDIIIVFD